MTNIFRVLLGGGWKKSKKSINVEGGNVCGG